jgi:hypothetical protein
MDRDKKSNLYRGPYIYASYQVSVHMVEGFQRRRLKCEKLTDDRRRTTDAKWWQKLTLPLARWAKISANQKQESNVEAIFVNGSGRNEQSYQRTFHRCFLPSFGSFGQTVSEEKNLKNQPIRNKNRLWWPYLLTDRDGMSNLYRGPSIDASYKVLDQ